MLIRNLQLSFGEVRKLLKPLIGVLFLLIEIANGFSSLGSGLKKLNNVTILVFRQCIHSRSSHLHS